MIHHFIDVAHHHELIKYGLLIGLVAGHHVAHRAVAESVDKLRLKWKLHKGEADPFWLAVQQVQLTPMLAAQWLGMLCERNQGWEPGKIDRYADLLVTGKWEGSYSPVVFERRYGCLTDGKHRCAAVLRTGVPIMVLRAYGITLLHPDRGCGSNARPA